MDPPHVHKCEVGRETVVVFHCQAPHGGDYITVCKPGKESAAVHMHTPTPLIAKVNVSTSKNHSLTPTLVDGEQCVKFS